MPKGDKRRVIAPEEASVFCQQIGLILSAGMPLYEGIEALSGGYKNTSEQAEFEKLSQCVDKTGSLTQAMEESGIFPRYLVEMTRVGERTGRLEQVMGGLAAHYERESRIRGAVMSAVAYPLVLMVMMACVIAVLVGKVLPIFERAMGGIELSAASGALMRLGMNTGRVVLILVGAAVVLALLCWLLLKSRWRARVSALLLKLFPPAGRLAQKLAASRFASVMSMMIASGFPLEEALEMMPSLMEDERARAQVNAIAARMKEGMPFCDAMEASALFSPLNSRMVRTGYLAGQVDQVMAKVADIYEREVDEGVGRLIAVIEPTLVAVLSIVIGAILLSVMLPMAGMISSIV